MKYTAVHLHTSQELDIYLAQQALEVFEVTGSEERDEEHIIYLLHEINESQIREALGELSVDFSLEYLEEQNWNKQWEENFDPVVIDDYCYIKAEFHPERQGFQHIIRITPKMSFGTGHHATTAQVMRMMRNISFEDKRVLDFGTGTGILAILAEKEGASQVVAIDNDHWSVENTQENILDNFCQKIEVRLGSLDDVQEKEFDVILANINRNILLMYMQQMANKLKSGGTILMSGILKEDEETIVQAAQPLHLTLEAQSELNNWICLKFTKNLLA